jgi:DNA-directed RNA polymerase subunit RPC12/RpoP
MKHSIDTDGLLDRCAACGARARDTEDRAMGTYGVQCSECANSVDLITRPSAAIIKWNQTQRALRDKAARQ